jgi:hypothetical protein
LDQELFISFATLSGYVGDAELADSIIGNQTGERVKISAVTDIVYMESEDDISSQSSTLSELAEDDEHQYQMEEEWDEERAERSDPTYRAR